MAATEIIFGSNANIYIGSNLIACAKSIKITQTTEAIDAQCAGTGKIKKKLPGDQEVKWSIDGLYRQYDSTDEATNQSVNDWFDGITAGTELTIVYKNDASIAGAKKCTVVGYADSVEMSGQISSVSTFTASGWGNSIAWAANS